ncbi:MAG: BON domain-containing protein [Burkholderiales bacterium]|nr:BON domain-containing protein [Burkholderiales bacterium]
MKNTSATYLAAIAMALALTACAPVMMGGVLGTAMIASDRRTTGIQVEDEGISQRSASAIKQNFGEKEHVNVTSYNRQVLITGEVSSDRVRAQVEQLIGKIENVRLVVNELGIGPATSLSERSADLVLVAKVKAAMIDTEDVFASVYKIVVERGTVYLMGRVTQREGNRATEVARGVGGVKRVVRVFEYISEEELNTLQPKKVPVDDSKPTPVSPGTSAPVSTNLPAPATGAVVTPVK